MSVIQKPLITPEDTIRLAQNLAQTFGHHPLLIFLRGDLGAGKTTFAQSFIKQILGPNTVVTSPTFSYFNTYQGQNLAIYHFDLYRIQNITEIEALGLTEFLQDETALRLIEWPEIATRMLPAPDLDIQLTPLPQSRLAKISFPASS